MDSYVSHPHRAALADAPIEAGAVLLPDIGLLVMPRPALDAAAARTIDIVLSVVALLLALPLMLVVALIIRLDSPGPALFRQLRVGRGGRLFVFYKFRTMYVDARERFPELYRYQYSEQELRDLRFKMRADPRLTRVGRWLRKTTLDELPNFVNVLLGDMALVGPRPEIPEMLRYYAPDELRKFAIRPGVTGMAQISGRGNLQFHETVGYDLDYCDRRSLRLDVAILLRTIYVCVISRGAF